jgi:protein subunit release factor B
MHVLPQKAKALVEAMGKAGIYERDLRETFIRSSGAGGQNINKVATCVRLVHAPTGLAVKCQNARTQALNRFLARRRLLEKITALREGSRSVQQAEEQRIRRQKRKRSQRAKEKILLDKAHTAIKKDSRKLSKMVAIICKAGAEL